MAGRLKPFDATGGQADKRLQESKYRRYFVVRLTH